MRSRRVLVLSAIVLLARAGCVQAQSASGTLSEPQVAVACAPSLASTPASGELRILGAQDTQPLGLFGPRDLVVVSGGRRAGVQLGQEYFIRRAFVFGSSRPRTIHTTGWLRVVAVNDTTAIALIDNVCDGVRAGDYLEPFAAPAPPANAAGSETPATLDFSSLGRVMFGNEERRLGGAGDFMLIDRGSGQTMTPGTRVAVYRDLETAGLPLTAIGDGVIVSIANGTPVMRITGARDAVQSGDYVVPHK